MSPSPPNSLTGRSRTGLTPTPPRARFVTYTSSKRETGQTGTQYLVYGTLSCGCSPLSFLPPSSSLSPRPLSIAVSGVACGSSTPTSHSGRLCDNFSKTRPSCLVTMTTHADVGTMEDHHPHHSNETPSMHWSSEAICHGATISRVRILRRHRSASGLLTLPPVQVQRLLEEQVLVGLQPGRSSHDCVPA